jgi:hypothetical protein
MACNGHLLGISLLFLSGKGKGAIFALRIGGEKAHSVQGTGPLPHLAGNHPFQKVSNCSIRPVRDIVRKLETGFLAKQDKVAPVSFEPKRQAKPTDKLVMFAKFPGASPTGEHTVLSGVLPATMQLNLLQASCAVVSGGCTFGAMRALLKEVTVLHAG